MFFRLVIRSILRDKIRFVTAILGVATATALLAWHLGLAMTTMRSGFDTVVEATKPYSAWITPKAIKPDKTIDELKDGGVKEEAEATQGRRLAGGGSAGAIPDGVANALLSYPSVRKMSSLSTSMVTIDMRVNGHIVQGPPVRGNFSLLDDDGTIPFETEVLEGRLPNMESDENEVILSDTIFSRAIPLPKIGETLRLILPAGTVDVKIVGYFKGTSIVLAFPSMYGNYAAKEALAKTNPRFPKKANLILIETEKMGKTGELASFCGSVKGFQGCSLYTVSALSERFRTDTAKQLISSLPLSLSLSVITASVLLATVLMIGLSLKRRRIAELRCVGVTQSGIARLIFFETLLIVVFGWAIGLSLAAVLLKVFLIFEDGTGTLPCRLYMGHETPLYSLLLAFVVGGLASILPVLSSIKVRPLETKEIKTIAMKRVSGWRILLSLALLLPMPLLALDYSMSEKMKTILMIGVALPAFFVALVIGMHPFIRVIELFMTRPVGALLRIDRRLLSRRLSRDPARVAGTILSIALGLGGFIAIHIWGGTLMDSFVPNKEWPDAIISVLPNGLGEKEISAIKECKGVRDGRVYRIDATQKELEGVENKGKILFLGIQSPLEVFGSEKPLANFKFIEGDRDEAAKKMESGGSCIIVEMLSKIYGLHAGDTIKVGGRELEVAGVVDLNWHMVTSRALVRTQFGNEGRRAKERPGRTLSMVFTGERFVREITGNNATYFLWVNMTDELRRIGGLQATVRLDDEINSKISLKGQSTIRVHHRDEIADGTLSHGSQILGTMAKIPFWSLVVTSTGIIALLIATIKGSKREFEVMRAIGVTKGEIKRILFGETLCLIVSALILSTIAGIIVGWSFTGVSKWMFSSGLSVKLIVPWLTIMKGIGFALAMCLIMTFSAMGMKDVRKDE